MSRFIVREGLLIDLIEACPFTLDKEFMIFFPGDSLIETQCKNCYALEYESDILKVYKVDHNKYRLIISNIQLAKNSKVLKESLYAAACYINKVSGSQGESRSFPLLLPKHGSVPNLQEENRKLPLPISADMMQSISIPHERVENFIDPLPGGRILSDHSSPYPAPDDSTSFPLNKELLIGISFYPENQQGDLDPSLSNILTYFVNPPYKLEKITITCTGRQQKFLNQILNQKYEGRRGIFSLNDNMRFEIYDKIMCRICKELPYIPYVVNCCASVYCELCKNTTTTCFDCGNNNINFREERFLNSFFKDLKYKCKCNSMYTFDNFKNHLYQCELTMYNCKVPKCGFEGTQGEMVAHAIDNHPSDILNNISSYPSEPNSSINRECPNCNNFSYNDNNCESCGYIYNNFKEIVNKFKIN